MNQRAWREFLQAWSREIIGRIMADDQEAAYFRLSPAMIESGWLGYDGATDAQLAAAETRLGVSLPPSYRAFLQVSNGFRAAGYFHLRLWSTEEIGWHYERHADLVDAWNGAADVPEDQTDAAGGEVILPHHFRATLEISEIGDEEVYLLNPKVQTAGEWQAWFFASWQPGARQYPSFEAMLVAERDQYSLLHQYQKLASAPGLYAAMEGLGVFKTISNHTALGILIQQLLQSAEATLQQYDPIMRDYYAGMSEAFVLGMEKLKHIADLKLTDSMLHEALLKMIEEMEAERAQAQTRPTGAKSMKDLLRGHVAQRQGGRAEGCRLVIRWVKRYLPILH